MDNKLYLNWIQFYSQVKRLKTTRRQGWQRRKVPAAESVAEHIFGVCLLALATAREFKVDSNQIVTMALLHDLGESQVGDMTPFDKNYDQKNTLEEKAMSRLLKNIDKDGLLLEWWKDVAYGRTQEGRLVKDLDKIEMAMQAFSYEQTTGINLQEFYDHARNEIQNQVLLDLLKVILDQRKEGEVQ